MISREDKEKAIGLLVNGYINSVTFSETADILIKEGRRRAEEKVAYMNDGEIMSVLNRKENPPIVKKSLLESIKGNKIFKFIDSIIHKPEIQPKRKGFVTMSKKRPIKGVIQT